MPVCAEAAARGFATAPGGWALTESEWKLAALPSAEVAPGFTALARALAKGPSRVFVLLLPQKGLVIPGGVAGYDTARGEDQHRALAQLLSGTGLSVVDTLDAARAPIDSGFFYLLRDPHLSHPGGRRVASLFAGALRTAGLYDSLPRVAYRTVEQPAREHPREFVADNIVKLCGGEAPPHERTAIFKVEAPDTGLVDETPLARVALWGSSNSGLGGLDRFTEEAIQSPVDTLATRGGGILGSLYAALREDDYATAPPVAVAWELAVSEYWRPVDGAPNPQDPDVYREIVPAAWGSCADESALAVGDWVASGATLLAAPARSWAYVALEAERADVRALSLGGEVADQPLGPRLFADYERLPASRRWFLDLGTVHGQVRLSATWESPSAARVRAKLCAAPK